MIRQPANFSPDRLYRYTLYREWDMCNPSILQVIGLNPSTADEGLDDPTIRRCVGFAKAWGYGALVMTNLFAYRSTDPLRLYKTADPVGADNDAWVLAVAARATMVLAAWGGSHGGYHERDRAVLALFQSQEIPLYCLGYTVGGHPKHPLYCPKILRPIPYADISEEVP